MTKRTLLFACSILSFTFLIGNVSAQKNTSKDYSSYPYWIAMIKDTNTNYFEAVKAFNTYWKNREKPQTENEKFDRAGKEDVKSKNLPYSFEYRKFKNWQMRVKPYVQNDGHILFPYQRYRLRKDARSANPTNTVK
jgi:hypothetical protein